MSTPFSSRALRTLRRLVRPAISFPLPQDVPLSSVGNPTNVPVQITLFRGGEGRTPLVRRRFRRALANIPAQHSLPFTVKTAIRYGARSVQDRRLNHPQIGSIRALLRGERLSLEIQLCSVEKTPFTPVRLQTFLQQANTILNRDFGLSILSSANSLASGPSSRLLRIALPALSSLEQNKQKVTFQIGLFRSTAIEALLKTPFPSAQETVISAIERPVVTVLSSINSVSTIVSPLASYCTVAHHSILRSLAFRSQRLLVNSIFLL